MPRRVRVCLTCLASLLIVVTIGLPLGGVALAAPPSSLDVVKRQIANAQQRLAALQERSEVAAERYNAGRLALAEVERVAAGKQRAADAAQARLTAARRQVGAFAAQLYRQGGAAAASSLVDSVQDPQQFVDRAAYADHLAQQRTAVLAAVTAAERDAQVSSDAARQALAAQQRIVERLAADRRQVQAAADEAQSLLGELRKKQAELIRRARIAAARAAAARKAAEERAARAAEARARAEAAELARQQAANERARQAFDAQPADPPATTGPSSGSVSGNAASMAVRWAYRELGKPYVWAATGPDAFDCSGLTLYVYAKAGIYLPHFSQAQYQVGRHVSRSELRPGDLVFFGSPIHHMGIYIGNNQMIHAPHTGDVVKISSLDGYYTATWAGATRVVG